MDYRFIVSSPVFLCFYLFFPLMGANPKRVVDECFCYSPASFAQLFRQGLDKNL